MIKTEFRIGDIVEAIDYNFRLYKNGQPTKYYMRGIIIEVLSNTCKIKSFHNGNIFEIDKTILEIIKERTK